jgi:hypothetical protein
MSMKTFGLYKNLFCFEMRHVKQWDRNFTPCETEIELYFIALEQVMQSIDVSGT